MAAKLERTNTPGIFRRHTKACDRKGRCECSYVVVWRTAAASTRRRSARSPRRGRRRDRDAGDRRPVSRVGFEDYFARVDRVLRRPHGARVLGNDRGRSTGARSSSTRSRGGARGSSPRSSPRTCASLFGELREGRRVHVGDQEAAGGAVGDVRDRGRGRADALEPGPGRPDPAAPQRGAGDERRRRSREPSWRSCWRRSPRAGGCSSSSWPTPACGSRRRSGSPGQHLDLGERPQVKVREQVYRGERRGLKSAPRAPRRAAVAGHGGAAARAPRATTTGARTAPVFAVDGRDGS